MTANGIETQNLENSYEAAHGNAIVIDRSELGMLKFSGETRLDLINRMSTQDVSKLASGEGAATVLTTDIGRIIDRIFLYASSDAVYCLTGAQNSDRIARYLMRFVFFQDDFHIEDLSPRTAIFGVYGQQAGERLAASFNVDTNLPLHHWRQIKFGQLTLYVHRTDAVAGEGYWVMIDAKDREATWQIIMDAGITPASNETFEYLRIESGLPLFGHELTEDYIPLEAALWSDVSFNKGCYIGQEIIARMESRGRLAKRLVQLRPGQPVQRGGSITADGKQVGTVTSAALGPVGPLALGYVKTTAIDAASPLQVDGVQAEYRVL